MGHSGRKTVEFPIAPFATQDGREARARIKQILDQKRHSLSRSAAQNHSARNETSPPNVPIQQNSVFKLKRESENISGPRAGLTYITKTDEDHLKMNSLKTSTENLLSAIKVEKGLRQSIPRDQVLPAIR